MLINRNEIGRYLLYGRYGHVARVCQQGNTQDFFENELEGSTYYILDGEGTISIVKAFEESDIAIEMIVDRTTNTLISVDQGSFGAMSTDYILEIVTDDEE